ncbi:MAG: SAM-dependent chlorinase/fluorinase [Desulfurococcaceae archaeon TW002]
MRPLIAVLTDYGLKDHYVGHLKAVIKLVCPETEIIDITHDTPKFNIVLASHILKITKKYLPKKTVVLAVVDPGVGSLRRNIIIETRNHVYVGPDNGLLIPATSDENPRAYEINVSKVKIGRVSHTFHGRDIYAPAAAMIACGVSPESLGSEVRYDELVKPPIVLDWAEVIEDGLKTKIVHLDDFGNIITSLSKETLEKVLRVRIGDKISITTDFKTWYEAKYVESFSHVREGELAIYEGSYELIEVAVYMGRAADIIKGTEIILKPI